ncbi:bacterioferritin [Blochmannia endosymbiont of Colobopsis nipponica]|uniref:bacterioferritin n=1 Tax=Blochmannia endosymbiont of Colobopsis nipponica TaxID=2681987 RepID=UPI001783B9DB|nr:bacterioferritin [Blochmannia endosymbiont of Colobopsis nipponica]QOI11225.1 bacterioferritin [Blochmannia endosymbiont of Colobopsis nipponica]
MKIDDQVVNHFNNILKNELVAINQYLLHSSIFKKQGLVHLFQMEYQESMEEQKHADSCIMRILFLDGVLDISRFDKLSIGNDVESILKNDLDLELRNIQSLRASIAYIDSTSDYVSRDIMLKILVDEEKHVDFLETELYFISKIGMCNYLQSQMKNDYLNGRIDK